jgi:hypothetical protein
MKIAFPLTSLQGSIDMDMAPSLKDYGAKGDGVTNDTAAVEKALLENTYVRATTGSYLVDRISIVGASKYIIGEGLVTFVQNHPMGIFDFKGGWDEIDSITGFTNTLANLVEPTEPPANSYVTQLTTTNNHIFLKNDVIKIVSNDTTVGMNSTGQNNDYRQGEYVTVGVDSGTNIVTLNQVLCNTYVNNSRLARLKPYRFVLKNLEFTIAPTLALQMNGVYSAVITARAAMNCLFEDLRFSNQYGRGIANYAYNSMFVNNTFRNLKNRPSKSNYGYGIEDGGHGTKVLNIDGSNVRHVYSANSNTVAADSNDFEYFGGTRNVTVTNGTGEGCQSAAFDTHEGADTIIFNNLIVKGNYQGANSGGNAYTARGKNIIFNNSIAIRCKTGFNINVTDGCTLNNCQALQTSGLALSINGMPTTGGIMEQKNIKIHGGIFEGGFNTGGALSQVVTVGASGYTVDAEFKDSTFIIHGSTSGSRFIDTYGAYLKIKGCTFDFSNFSGINALTGIILRDNISNYKLKDIEVTGKSSSATQLTFINGISAGLTSKIELVDMLYKHDTLSPLIVGSNITKESWRARYVFEVGNAKKTSAYILKTAVNDLDIGISNSADSTISVRLIGNNGPVTIANLPVGYQAGQLLNITNQSNGPITCALPNFTIPTPVSGVSKGVMLYFDETYWRVIFASN